MASLLWFLIIREVLFFTSRNALKIMMLLCFDNNSTIYAYGLHEESVI